MCPNLSFFFPTAHSAAISRFSCIFFPRVAPDFLCQQIRQVIWPSPECDTKVHPHTHSVCYLALFRGVLAVILVKHKSIMTVIRVHVYTAVCTCHTHLECHNGAHKSMITIPTPSSKTTSQ